jgi:CubicO group peptidase (beta-lactamase class C family)
VSAQQIVHLRGFGAAEPGGQAVTPDTPFMLASTSKELTALAVMQLVELRRLDLDAAVRAYLPWFATADRELSDRITVRQLLNQTSGLSTLTGLLEDTSDDRGPTALERAVRRLDTQPLLSQPGRHVPQLECKLHGARPSRPDRIEPTV